MKKILNKFILVITALFCGCASHTIISDDELADIFHDAYITNAYINVEKISLDSLKIYEPIFNKYGYTTDDVKYTIGNFSRRKSARLGDVVEKVITRLEARGIELDKEVSILDTIDATAVRRYSREILYKPMVKLHTLRDTTKLQITIDNINEGSYVVEFDYLIDSLDKNVGSYRAALWFESDALDHERKPVKNHHTTMYLIRGGIKSTRRTIHLDRAYKRMVIEPVDIMDKKNRPHVTIRDIKVKYNPTAEIATQKIYDSLININLFSDELLPAKNSL